MLGNFAKLFGARDGLRDEFQDVTGLAAERAADRFKRRVTELAERIDITLANLSILKTGKARAIRFNY